MVKEYLFVKVVIIVILKKPVLVLFIKKSQLIVNRTNPVPPVKKTILKLKNVKVKRSAKKLGLKASLKEGKNTFNWQKDYIQV